MRQLTNKGLKQAKGYAKGTRMMQTSSPAPGKVDTSVAGINCTAAEQGKHTCSRIQAQLTAMGMRCSKGGWAVTSPARSSGRREEGRWVMAMAELDRPKGPTDRPVGSTSD